jgi:A/G-specific adenine glycosylase
MELGALVCTPRQPSCLFCPLATLCQARRLGLQDVIPRVAPKPRPAAVTEAAAVVYHQDRVLIVQRGPGRLWERFWEFPTIHVAGADPAGRSFGAPVTLADGVRRLTGIPVEIGPPMATLRFGVTHHRVTLTAHRARGNSAGTLQPGPGLIDARWVEPSRLSDYTFGSAGRRLIARINHGESRS